MQKNWYRLDTAALIFPAVARRDWCNVFRVSATLSEAVDAELLQRAVAASSGTSENMTMTG